MTRHMVLWYRARLRMRKNRIYISWARLRMTKKESTYAAQEAESGKKAKKRQSKSLR